MVIELGTFKYGLSAYFHFTKCFKAMPLVAIVSTTYGKFMCVHGGIGPEIETLDNIMAIDRYQEPSVSGALCDLLWADPAPDDNETRWQSNLVRGCSYTYGHLAVFEFLENNDLICIVRAHELQSNGFQYHFIDDKFAEFDKRATRDIPPVLTIFSAPNYCDLHDNMVCKL